MKFLHFTKPPLPQANSLNALSECFRTGVITAIRGSSAAAQMVGVATARGVLCLVHGRGTFGGALTTFSQDRQQGCPAGGVEELEGVGGGVSAGEAAEEGFFVLVTRRWRC